MMDEDVGMVDFPMGFIHDRLWWTITKPGHPFFDAAEIKDSALDPTRWFDAESDLGERRPFIYIKKDECFVPVPEHHLSVDTRPLIAASLLPLEQSACTPPVQPSVGGVVNTVASRMKAARESERISKRINLGFMPTQRVADVPKSGRHHGALLFRQFLGSLTMAATQSAQTKPASNPEWVRLPRMVEAKHPEYLKGMIDAFALLAGADLMDVVAAPGLPDVCIKDPSVVAGMKQIAGTHK